MIYGLLHVNTKAVRKAEKKEETTQITNITQLSH